MRALCLLAVLIISFPASSQQQRPDTLSFRDRIQPISAASFFKTDGYYNWCGSIIGTSDGVFHLFYSRWKKEYSFDGWLTHSEIAHAVAPSPTGPWTYRETVLRGRGAKHWDAITAHNPKIKYFKGKYYLYYISTNYGGQAYSEERLDGATPKSPDWKILRKNQRTGVAFANSLKGPWHRLDHPIVEPAGPITTLAVNPAITQGKDGRFYLIVKGDKPNETRFIRNQAIAIASTPLGPFTIQPKPVIDYLDTEDMSLWYDSKRDYYYAIFHSTAGFIGMVSSPDGINWQKAREFDLMPKKLAMEDGSTFVPDRMERPFVYIEENEPRVLSFAVKKGDDSFLVFVRIANK